MRIGVYGGTFDPVHQGHLILAEQCREQGQLEQVWFMPAPQPPNKMDKLHSVTRFDQRVEMLQLALAGNAAFRVEEIEKERTGPSYTVVTLTELHQRHPNDDLWLLLGSDTLADLENWREPLRLVQLVGLLVMPRPGWPVLSAEQLHQQLQQRYPHDDLWRDFKPIRLQVVQAPIKIDISSTELRSRLSTGQTVRYLLPRAVEMYIHDKQLYRA